MSEKYDLIIIGGGPAGLSAGIYGGRAKRKTLILEKGTVGGRAALTESIVNYPGFSEISGRELTQKMKAQAEGFGVEIRKETVKSISIDEDGSKTIKTRRNEYTADAVIVASGTSPRKLGIKGEEEFTGKGVAYCAACDAEFFKGQTVAVLGSGDQAIEESELIARFAEKVIIIVIHNEGILDCSKLAAEKAFENPKISFIWNSTVSKINGDTNVESITLKNLKSGTEEDIECDGIFLFVGAVPNTSFLPEKSGYIETNTRMETEVNGIFAAGDVRKKQLRQVSTAISDGAVAAVMADRFIEEKNLYNEIRSASFREEIYVILWSSEGKTRPEEGEKYINQTKQGNFRIIEIDTVKNPYLARYFGAPDTSEKLALYQLKVGEYTEI